MARLLLRVDGVELLVKTFVRGHPAVDGAALAGLVLRRFRSSRTSLAENQEQRPAPVRPVMWRATAVRLLKVWPSYQTALGVDRHPVIALAPFAQNHRARREIELTLAWRAA